MATAKNLSGTRFSRLVVLELAGVRSNRERIWKCACDCGAQTDVRQSLLTSGKTTSCGCYAREVAAKLLSESAKHGHARRGNATPEYRSWRAMINRCEIESAAGYAEYGGRGIRVCERWASFENFLADMGERPAGTTIERDDVNGHYEPGNCRWATGAEQSRNTRRTILVEIDGEKMCLKDACAAAGINYSAARKRIKKGRDWRIAV